jgi:alpha-1,2-mannosyltransferase
MTTPTYSIEREGGMRLTGPGLRHAASRGGSVLAYAVVPMLLLTLIVAGSIHNRFAFDFHQFWQGGHDVVSGHSPYPSADSLPPGGDVSLGPIAIQQVFRFPYPAPAALAMVPFGALPFTLAASLFLLLSIGAIYLALRLLGVVDWRCYGLLCTSIVTLGALRLGTFTPFLLLGLAAAWRFRNRLWPAALAVAALVVAKLFLWPLLLWLLFTRRARAAGLALALAAVITVASWAALGFAGFGGYPHLLATLSASVEGKGWSIVALGQALGLSSLTAKLLSLALGGSVLAFAALAPPGRRDLRTFALTIVAAIVMSPIVWLHYFLLLAAPLAIAFPRLGPAWFIPLAFWVWPFQETGGDVWKIALGVAALAALAAAVLASTSRPVQSWS